MRRIPFDIGELIEVVVIQSPLSARFRGQSPETLRETEKTLVNFIRQLGMRLHAIDDEYMSNLLDPARAARASQAQHDANAWDVEAVADSFAAFHTNVAWWGAEGVLDLLGDARACAARYSEGEIRKKLGRGEFGPYDDSEQRFDEAMAIVSRDRIWAYLDWAVEDASYLGPQSELPSTKHAKRAWLGALVCDGEGSTSDDDAGWLYDINLF